jgi:hypothetical protein
MAQSHVRTYNSVLVAFMQYRDDVGYDKGHVFTPEDLVAITAEEV